MLNPYMWFWAEIQEEIQQLNFVKFMSKADMDQRSKSDLLKV